jgi:hypothetical protein
MSRNGTAREKAALLTLQGLTPDEIAAQAGVSRRTVFRWRRCPEFVSLLADLRKQVVSGARDRLTAMLTGAADELGRLLQSQEAPIRLRAATAIIDRHAEFVVAADLEERIGRLEAGANRMSSNSNGRFW